MRRMLVAFVVTVVLLLAGGTGLAAAKAAAAVQATTRFIAGCAVVANPNSLDYTQCPSANLSNADLAATNLTDADLTSADLVGADLRGADLAGADLSGADLTGADLTGANLTGVDLIGASLTNVTWAGTTCPDGSTSDQVGRTCVDDLMVLAGAAVGANGTVRASGAQSQPPSSPVYQFDQLPLTGRPILPMLLSGLDLMALGLVLLIVSRLTRRPRPRERAPVLTATP